MAPASTGKLVINKIAVTAKAQIINGNLLRENLYLTRLQKIVAMKFILPMIEEAPAKCRLKIARSTEIPLWNLPPDRGGYTVHPVPAPVSAIADINNRIKAGGNNQKDRLFSRGKAISANPNIRGINQFPNPPMEIGMTEKKIIINACLDTNTLYK